MSNEAHLAALARRLDEVEGLSDERNVIRDLAQMVLLPGQTVQDESPATSVARLATTYISLTAQAADLANRLEQTERQLLFTQNNCGVFERRLGESESRAANFKNQSEARAELRDSYASEVRALRRAVEKALSRMPGSNKTAREHLAEADEIAKVRVANFPMTDYVQGVDR